MDGPCVCVVTSNERNRSISIRKKKRIYARLYFLLMALIRPGSCENETTRPQKVLPFFFFFYIYRNPPCRGMKAVGGGKVSVASNYLFPFQNDGNLLILIAFYTYTLIRVCIYKKKKNFSSTFPTHPLKHCPPCWTVYATLHVCKIVSVSAI